MKLKILTVCLLLTSESLAATSSVTSDVFNLTLSSSESTLNGLVINQQDDNIFVSASGTGETLTGAIQGNGGFLIQYSSADYIGISSNYLTITNDNTNIATPFSIEDGYLQLYGEKDFKVIPSGETDTWILASSNAVSSASNVFTVNIKPVKSDGETAASFSVSAAGKIEISIGLMITSVSALLMAFY